ncbi:hypothetical protein V6N13_078409 [Hibiscus sabdariffa]
MHCIVWRVQTTEDFELHWNQVVSLFGLGSDKHTALLYNLRESWALSYVRVHFLARMATSAYSKSVDAFLKGSSVLNHVCAGFLSRLALQPIYITSHIKRFSICI